MNKPTPDSLLTKAQAKAKLGDISDGILSRLVRQGKLRAVKFGKTTPLRFRALDVERCLESLLTPGAGGNPEGDTRNEPAPDHQPSTLNPPLPPC